jgi:uncharacterized membrane protein
MCFTFFRMPKVYSKNNKSRLEAFCDGVFAIAITLLILEIKIPHPEDIEHYGGLKPYLIHLWPSFFAYGLSFYTIGIYWANHHTAMRLVTSTDHYFNLLTIFFLMTISFIPFPTAILGEYITDEEVRPWAIRFYSMSQLMIVLSISFVWAYARYKKRLLDRNLKDSYLRLVSMQLVASITLHAVALSVSFFYPVAGFTINVILIIAYLVAPKEAQYNEND